MSRRDVKNASEERSQKSARKSREDEHMVDDRRDRRHKRSPSFDRREERRSPRRSPTRSPSPAPHASSSSGQADVLAAINGLKLSVDTSMATLNQKFTDFTMESHNRFNSITTRMDGFNDRLAMVEAEREEGPRPTWGPVPDSVPAPLPSAVPAPTDIPSNNWNRVPDPTIIKIEAKFADKSRAKVSLFEVKKLLDTMAADVGIAPDQYKFDCKELSDFHIIRFGGLAHLAAKQALHFIKGTKLPDGTFRNLSLLDPSGTEAHLFLNLDKNGRQRKVEGATRRLANLIISHNPALKTKIFPRREEGIVNCQFKLLASITVSPESTTLSWDVKKAAFHGVDFDVIKREFLEDENITWGS